jgi:hypothetical protein
MEQSRTLIMYIGGLWDQVRARGPWSTDPPCVLIHESQGFPSLSMYMITCIACTRYLPSAAFSHTALKGYVYGLALFHAFPCHIAGLTSHA